MQPESRCPRDARKGLLPAHGRLLLPASWSPLSYSGHPPPLSARSQRGARPLPSPAAWGRRLVGTGQLERGRHCPLTRPGDPLPAQGHFHAPPRLCSRVPLSYLHREVTVHNLDSNPAESYGAQSHIPRGGVLRPRGSQITLPAERRGPREAE